MPKSTIVELFDECGLVIEEIGSILPPLKKIYFYIKPIFKNLYNPFLTLFLVIYIIYTSFTNNRN